MRVEVDEDRCCGAGSCVLVAPEVFDQREDDGVVVLLDAEPPGQVHGGVREAADICPAGAIALRGA
ncbi:ferredoxin [Prauserella sp. PE36]|uniref:ferredoxin n=1 Tax=Prauserella sp. PE36 TaxID=1504709 RepID=UPI000DE24873|nr:ferredoxin [Prauserella sp. PE36]RBM16247.1 ferredoxin [Prauserella sp. PE36]